MKKKCHIVKTVLRMKYHYDLNIQLGTKEGHKINRVQSLTQVQLMNGIFFYLTFHT